MKPDSLLLRLYYGIRRHPERALVNIALGFTAAWAFVEPLVQGLEVSQFYWQFLFLLFGIALVTGLYASALPHIVRVKVPGIRNAVTLKFGDIFDTDSDIAIAVNEFFDGRIGPRVSNRSLHGQCVERLFSGDGEHFESTVDAALTETKYCIEDGRSDRKQRYPIGTVAVVRQRARKIYCVALARSDLETYKASADIEELLHAVRSLYSAIRHYGNGDPVAIPLMGSGSAGVKMSPKGLLHLLLIGLLRESRENNLESDVTIVLHPSMANQIDLSEYKYSQW